MKELSKQEIESIELAAVKYVNDRWENSDNKPYFNQTACSKDYIAGATEQAIKAKELVEALRSAIEVIKQWHNADEVWDIYYNHSPEMKPIREALLNYKP